MVESDSFELHVSRIRDNEIIIEDVRDAPKPEEIAQLYDYEAMLEEESELVEEKNLFDRWIEIPDNFMGDYESLFNQQSSTEDVKQIGDGPDSSGEESADDELDGGLDEEPDVPEIDMM